MNTRWVLLMGAVAGLCVSIAVLALMWFGVRGVLNVGHTDLMYVVWPSSLMLTVGWRSTLPGIAITVVSVALNCSLYTVIAYGVHRVLTANRSVSL
jgi:hypothetical protein